MRSPRIDSRALFLRVLAPAGAISSGVVSGIVRSACKRVGLSSVGSHALRHMAATEMLKRGASLPEIGEVLRHREEKTTAIYAKCAARRSVVSPVQPGGTWREVPGSNGLPDAERLRGQEHAS